MARGSVMCLGEGVSARTSEPVTGDKSDNNQDYNTSDDNKCSFC